MMLSALSFSVIWCLLIFLTSFPGFFMHLNIPLLPEVSKLAILTVCVNYEGDERKGRRWGDRELLDRRWRGQSPEVLWASVQMKGWSVVKCTALICTSQYPRVYYNGLSFTRTLRHQWINALLKDSSISYWFLTNCDLSLMTLKDSGKNY